MASESQGTLVTKGSDKRTTLLIPQGQPVAATLVAAALTLFMQWRCNRKLRKVWNKAFQTKYAGAVHRASHKSLAGSAT